MTLAAVGLGVYVDTVEHLKKARIGPIKQNAPAATRTVGPSVVAGPMEQQGRKQIKKARGFS
jgi:hypothetical protein